MEFSRRTLLAYGAAAATLAAGEGALAAEPSLQQLAAAKGLRFGTAMPAGYAGKVNPAWRDAGYRALIAAQCGIIVPENELKWYAVRPTPTTYDFSGADKLAAFARQHGMAFRGHNLLWNRNKFQPGWMKGFDFGPKPAASAEKMLVDHIHTVAGRYAGQIDSWDVVNETINPATGEIRDTVWTRLLGPRVIDIAFHATKQAAPKAKLVYNDYMGYAAKDAKHRAGVLKLLHGLKSRGVPIDALGVQSHIANGDSSTALTFSAAEQADWRRFLDEVRGMGLDLLITEFDVNDVAAPADIAKRDADVAAIGRAYLDMMVAYPELKQVLAWGLCDKYSWLQTYWPRADHLEKRGTPYDDHMQAKPLRRAVADALRAAPVRKAWA